MGIINKIYKNIEYLAHRSEFIKSSYILNLLNYLVLPKKEIVHHQPLDITCYLTDRCTLNCNFCPHHSLFRNEKYPYLHTPAENMTFPTFKKVIDTFPKTPRISICGVGEPFLNSDIYKMIDYAIEKKKLIFIVTNGTLLKDHINEITKRRIFGINISLNCITQDEFNNLTSTNKYKFDEIIATIQELTTNNKNKIKISLSFVIQKNRLFQIEKILDFVSTRLTGISNVSFHNLLYFGIEKGYPLSEVMIESDPEVEHYLEKIKRNAKKYPFTIGLLKLRPLNSEDITCHDFFTQLHVDSNGNVSGCGRSIAPNQEFGNVLTEGKEVWNNHFFQKMRRMAINRDFKANPVCKNCVGS